MINAIRSGNWMGLVYMALGVLISMCVHEFAHAYVSYLFGDSAHRIRGKFRWNPLESIDWTGMLCLALFGFGWAKPVSIQPWEYKDEKTGIIWTAFAGPLSNFLLTFVCLLIYYALILFVHPTGAMIYVVSFIAQTMYYTAILSAGFGIFNLIPIPPLDGSRIFWAFLPDDQYRKMQQSNGMWMMILMLLVVLGLLDGPLSTLRSALLDGMSNVILGMFGIR